MKPVLSIVIPHKPTPMNDKALMLNIGMLLANTLNPYELIIETTVPKCPYVIWNEISHIARADILVFTNSDVLMAKEWDKVIPHIADNEIMTGYLAEAGNIGVASVNIPKSFGKTPDEFDKASFDSWASSYGPQVPESQEQRGWYMPCAMRREWFLSTGGFDTAETFPAPNDIKFWEMCIHTYKTKLTRIRSFAYHFQALSQRG